MGNNRNPSEPRRAESPVRRTFTKFLGMIAGEPANKLPTSVALKNFNVIDFGEYFKIRPGSKLYSDLTVGWRVEANPSTDEMVITDTDGNPLADNPFRTGDAVYFSGSDLPIDNGTGLELEKDKAYYIAVELTSSGYHYTLYYNRSDSLYYAANNIEFDPYPSSSDPENGRIYFGKINGFCDHTESKLLIWLIGQGVFITDKKVTAFNHVLNLNNESPDGISTIVPYDKYALLSSTQGGLFKIILDEDFYYMFKMNQTPPDTLLNDVSESLVYDSQGNIQPESLQYGYLYLYSLSRIIGGGYANSRISDGALLQMETATNQVVGVDRDYGEVFFVDQPGVTPYYTPDQPSTVTGMYQVKGKNARGVTHFSVYRTKEIGTRGGFVPNVNRRDQFTWVDDVPVCKPFKVSVFDNGDGTWSIYDPDHADISDPSPFVDSDVGCILRIAVSDPGFNGDAVAELKIIQRYALVGGFPVGLGVLPIPTPIGITGNVPASATPSDITLSSAVDAALFVKNSYYYISDSTYSEYVQVTAIDLVNGVLTIKKLVNSYTSPVTIKSIELPSSTLSNPAGCIGGYRMSTAVQQTVGGKNLLSIMPNETFVFTPNDAGRIIFLSDGSIRHITEVLATGNDAYVAESGDFGTFDSLGDIATGLTAAMQYDSDGDDIVYSRQYGDVKPDNPQGNAVVSLSDTLEFNDPLYVPRRMFSPFPNTDIIVAQDGFVVLAKRGDSRYFFTDTASKPYCLGQYEDPDQTRSVEGTIQHMISMPFRVVVLMKDKTGVLTTNSSQNFGNTDVGENIYVLPDMSIVDDLKGVILWKMIAKKNSSLVYAVTSDGAFRSFDGYQWSAEDLSYVKGLDAVSKEYIRKIDQSKPYAAIYSNSGGIKLWFFRTIEGESVQTCLRMATENSEGQGWSEYGGDDWVNPLIELGVFTILDDNDIQRVIVVDNDSNVEFKIFEIDTHDRIIFEKPYALDKIPENGIGGTEVAWSKRWGEEVVGSGQENDTMKHEQAYAYIQPDDRKNRGKTGYTATGQRSAQQLSYKAFIDGEQDVPAATAGDFPEKGEIEFPGRNVEAFRIMHELSGTAGEIVVTGVANVYLVKPKALAPELRLIKEHAYQKELATGKKVFICRDFKTIVNRVTGKDLGGGTVTMITGADNRPGSAAQFTSNITLDNPAIVGTYAIMLWSKESASNLIVGITTGWTVGAALHGWYPYFRTGTGLAANLVLVNGHKFDVRIYNKLPSSLSRAAYLDDLNTNSGNAYLPGFKS